MSPYGLNDEVHFGGCLKRLTAASCVASMSSKPSAGTTDDAGSRTYSASVPSGQSACTFSLSGPNEVTPMRICAGSATFSGERKG
jgi:hypothetical protein